MTESSSNLLTVKDVASTLKIGVRSVFRLLELRKLSCYRFGRTVRISTEQLQDFLQRQEKSLNSMLGSRFR